MVEKLESAVDIKKFKTLSDVASLLGVNGGVVHHEYILV